LIVQILDSYEFKKPSKSRYAPVVKALVDDGAFAVRLERGVDFPADRSLDNVQGAISQQVRNAGRRAKTFAEPPDALVVSLYEEGDGPRRRRARSKVTA
jgi:hypothetical protein